VGWVAGCRLDLFYWSVEGMSEAAVRDLFELNFFAVLSVTRAVDAGWAVIGPKR
jgi:hypothetical protein